MTGGVPFARLRQEEGVDTEDDEDYASDEDGDQVRETWERRERRAAARKTLQKIQRGSHRLSILESSAMDAGLARRIQACL